MAHEGHVFIRLRRSEKLCRIFVIHCTTCHIIWTCSFKGNGYIEGSKLNGHFL